MNEIGTRFTGTKQRGKSASSFSFARVCQRHDNYVIPNTGGCWANFPIVICMRQSLQRRRRWRCSLIWWIKSSRAYVEPLIPTPVIGRMYSRECASWPEFDAFDETIPPRVRSSIWRYARAFKTLFGWNGQWCERIMDNDQWNINKNKRKGRRAFADGGNNRNDFSL